MGAAREAQHTAEGAFGQAVEELLELGFRQQAGQQHGLDCFRSVVVLHQVEQFSFHVRVLSRV
jgi:hypothetical protein